MGHDHSRTRDCYRPYLLHPLRVAVGRARGERGLASPTILPLKNHVTADSVEAECPVETTLIYACDFYVSGIEAGERRPGGYQRGRIYNIDHHAPTAEMEHWVTSTMLALKAIGAGDLGDEPAYTVINHTDCDSVLSSALVMGLVPVTSTAFPDVHAAFAEASVSADHTGAPHPIADLLQGLDEMRQGNRTDAQYLEPLRNLWLLLDGQPLEPVARGALMVREARRARAEELVHSGRVRQIGPVAFGELSEELDGAFFLSLLPGAVVIMLVSPHPVSPDKWVVKIRLGANPPNGLTLTSLNFREFDHEFGGRWNAGSDKRGGGTAITPEAYLREITERIDRYLSTVAASA